MEPKYKLHPLHDTKDPITRIPRFQKWAIVRDGEKVGVVQHLYRPKNAGGSAWCAKLQGVGKLAGQYCGNDEGIACVIWHYDRNKLCLDIKNKIERGTLQHCI